MSTCDALLSSFLRAIVSHAAETVECDFFQNEFLPMKMK